MGGDACVYISWGNEDSDEFETEINLTKRLQVDPTFIFL